jgi:hypothetical protein
MAAIPVSVWYAAGGMLNNGEFGFALVKFLSLERFTVIRFCRVGPCICVHPQHRIASAHCERIGLERLICHCNCVGLHITSISVFSAASVEHGYWLPSGRLSSRLLACVIVRGVNPNGLSRAAGAGCARAAQETRPQDCYRPSAKHDETVLELHRDGLPYRLIGRNLGLRKNTVI